jgi:hypothetical protein
MLKITVIAAGTSGFVIGDSSEGRVAGAGMINNMMPQFDAAVRTVQAFRAESVQNLKAPTNDEYNESTVLSPEVTYGFDSEDDKAQFILSLQENVPPVATVEFQVGETPFYLINAKIRPITVVEEYEVSITLRYQISGGKITTRLPAAART